jgi:primase-polymerase (primpol)-like protein
VHDVDGGVTAEPIDLLDLAVEFERKRAATPAYGEFIAKTNENVVRIKQEKVEVEEERMYEEEEKETYLKFSTKQRSHIETLEAQVRDLGSEPTRFVHYG